MRRVGEDSTSLEKNIQSGSKDVPGDQIFFTETIYVRCGLMFNILIIVAFMMISFPHFWKILVFSVVWIL